MPAALHRLLIRRLDQITSETMRHYKPERHQWVPYPENWLTALGQCQTSSCDNSRAQKLQNQTSYGTWLNPIKIIILLHFHFIASISLQLVLGNNEWKMHSINGSRDMKMYCFCGWIHASYFPYIFFHYLVCHWPILVCSMKWWYKSRWFDYIKIMPSYIAHILHLHCI